MSGASVAARSTAAASWCGNRPIALATSAAPSATAALASVLVISARKPPGMPSVQTRHTNTRYASASTCQTLAIARHGSQCRSGLRRSSARLSIAARTGSRTAMMTSAAMAATPKNSTCSSSSWIPGCSPSRTRGVEERIAVDRGRGSRCRTTVRRNARRRPRSPARAIRACRARTRAGSARPPLRPQSPRRSGFSPPRGRSPSGCEKCQHGKCRHRQRPARGGDRP